VSDNDARNAPPSDSVVAAEIAGEQAFVDVVYRRLDESAEQAKALAVEGHGRGRLGHEGGLVERDAMVYQAARRIATLDAAHEGLVFGRLDLVDGDARYIGRIGLRDAEREVLLVDWRAPAASVFYQATPQAPAGIVRRRVLHCKGQSVETIEDELLDADAAADDLVVVGEGALLAQISRARDAHMHSVVATIQKEQDVAIRAPSRGVTSISGGPGTGKTVVALHRAAYLLYVDRRRFESGGVLVVGPSGVFMRYIERVLPSLGETSVTLRSLGEIVDGVTATRHDPPEVAAIKGSERMRRVLTRMVRSGPPDAPAQFRWFYRDNVLRLDERTLRRLRRQVLGGNKHNRSRTKAEHALIDALWPQVTGGRGLEDGRDDFVRRLTGSTEFEEFVAAWWPALDAVEAWGWLLDEQRLRRYGDGLLEPAEITALAASWAAPDDPSIEDVPLIDELRYQLGDVPEYPSQNPAARDPEAFGETAAPRQLMSFERDDASLRATRRIEDDAYAHLLVDEAQDLSPMQWRMLGRRGRYASWTVVGDPAQSAWPHPVEAQRARTEALRDKPEHAFRLSTNYRNSAEVFELAARVARVAVAEPDLPQAVRQTGIAPEHREVAPAALQSTVVAAVRDLAAAVEGTIAVVTPVDRRPEVADWLADEPYSDRLSVLDGLASKGLEFDAVVVVEPGEIVAESASGWRTLYVVLTRATQRLITLGTTPFPLDDPALTP
jgi:AAA domain/UvrD-like helicase C-terminal domain